MGDNEWLKLGAPAADPKWGKARGSSWGAKALTAAPPTQDEIEKLLAAAPNYGIEIQLPGH